MKRYLLFIFPAFHSMYDRAPAGGWNDLIGSYDSIEGCKSAASNTSIEHEDEDYEAQIVDIVTGQIVWHGEAGYDYSAGWNWKQ